MARLKWVTLEIKPPAVIYKSPKATEQIFAALHAVHSPPTKFSDRWIEGKIQEWFSFEIVGNQGDIKFYATVLEGQRNLIESQFYAQYPDAEIEEVEDYTKTLPKIVPDGEYDIFGTELGLAKDPAYPIKTYPYFEEPSGEKEYKRIDPLASLTEVLNQLENNEYIWIQYIIQPTGNEWAKKGNSIIEELLGKPPKKTRNGFSGIIHWIDDTFFGGVPKQEEKKKENGFMQLMPAVQDTIKRIEANLSRLAYKGGIRYAYIARMDVFNRSRTAGLVGVYKQFTDHNLNSFKPSGNTTTSVGKGLFKKRRLVHRKRYLYQAYRNRSLLRAPTILNTEALATLFHLPETNVKTPGLPRVEAKKGAPPVDLPTG